MKGLGYEYHKTREGFGMRSWQGPRMNWVDFIGKKYMVSVLVVKLGILVIY